MATEPTVFVVDDDPAIRDALRMLMRSVRLRVETYSSAHEFLTAYRPERAGCLVLDVRMPGMSGLELQEKLSRSDATKRFLSLAGVNDVTPPRSTNYSTASRSTVSMPRSSPTWWPRWPGTS